MVSKSEELLARFASPTSRWNIIARGSPDSLAAIFIMGCPWVGDVVESAISKCPFLKELASTKGEAFARAVAVNPTRPANSPIFPESVRDFRASFQLFHGATGVVPLVRTQQPAATSAAKCPFHHTASTAPEEVSGHKKASESSRRQPEQLQAESTAILYSPLAAAPFASASSGIFRFLPGPGDFLARRRRRRQERQDRRAEARRRANQPGSHTKSGSTHSAPQPHRSRLDKWRMNPVVGGLIPLSAAGRYACPPAVVAGRQAVARLRSVQFLRPRTLPVKLLGVGGHCFMANIPCGAVREHTEKFSLAWVVAVHATVPFFAFMRKGVGMPKWAILLTLASAVAGQAIGAKLERQRLAYVALARAQQQNDNRIQLEAHKDAAERGGCPLLRTCGEISQATPGAALFRDHSTQQQITAA